MRDPDVKTVSAARAELTETLREFRSSIAPEPVVFGSHRRPEAVIVPFAQYARSAPARVSGGSLQALRDHAALIDRLARANSVSDVRVYGSVARGEDTADSDVDLLVTPGESTSTFDLAQFASDVELLVGRPVDVASDRALDAVRDASILRDAVRL